MPLNSETFWKLLESSRLLSPTTMGLLGQQLANVPAKEAEAIARTLVEQKLITSYQAEILLAGHDGPFHYGNFTINDRFMDGPLLGQFKARHAPTQHPVCLTFFEGKAPADLERWQEIEQHIAKLKLIESPFLASFLDTVVMPNYRFAVSQRPEGTNLQERMPRKARLPWKDASTLLAQVAHGLESLHKHGLAAGSLSLESIWVSKSGFTQLRPNLNLLLSCDDQGESIRRDDWFQFGCCLFRIVTGKPFVETDGEQPETNAKTLLNSANELKTELAKHDLPAELQSLSCQLLLPRPELPVSGRSVSKLLAGFANKPLKTLIPADPPTLTAFRKSIARFVPGSGNPIEEIPELDTGENSPALIETPQKLSITISDSESSKSAGPSPLSKSRKKRRGPVIATLLGVWIFCGLLGIGAYYAANKKSPIVSSSNPTPTVDHDDANRVIKDDPDASPLASNTSENQTQIGPSILKQKLIPDDRVSLWQSPTEGPPLDLDGLPPMPKIVVTIRPDELQGDPEGKLLLQSFGPDFAQILESWETQTSVPFSEIEQLVVSLHSNEEFRYESFIRCQLKSPCDAAELMNRWARPKPQSTTTGNVYFIGDGKERGFVVLEENGLSSSDDPENSAASLESDASKNSDTIIRFGFGNAKMLAEVADSPRGSVGSIMQSLADRTDRRRHMNLLYLRPAVFNDEGQAFMAGKWSSLNRELDEILPDEIQGGSLSLHLDQGTFFEVQFAQTVDLKGVELMQRLQDRFRDLRDRTTQYITAIPASPYWDRVRLKLSLMIVDVFRSLRWGVENGEVVANCWLPPMAAHNLIAATELAASFSSGTSVSASSSNNAAAEIPQSLDELLQTKRTLKVANPPDLNLLMSDLESEIKEDFPGLPFQFHIRLMGPDLQVEGITQNQRPSELNMEQLALSEILTAIMVSANPAKDIRGASDPRCKLVWAIADDPDNPGQKMIAITTRAAAGQKKYQLPPAFRIE